MAVGKENKRGQRTEAHRRTDSMISATSRCKLHIESPMMCVFVNTYSNMAVGKGNRRGQRTEAHKYITMVCLEITQFDMF